MRKSVHERKCKLQMLNSASGALNQENNSRCTYVHSTLENSATYCYYHIICTMVVSQRVMVHRQNRINNYNIILSYQHNSTPLF